MMKKILLFALGLVFLVFSNCGNKVLANYDNGEITLSEVEQLAEIYNLKTRLNNPNLKRQFVKDYAVAKILSEKALAENLDKSEEAIYLKTLFEGNTIKNLIYKKKNDSSDKSEEYVFHARHILLRLDPKSVPNDAKFEQISNIRQEILDKKITFEEAVEKYSDDPATKTKKGDLGYFPRGVMVPDFQATVERMAGLTEKPSMRITVDNIKLLSKPEGSNIDLKQVSKNSIVTVLEKENPPGWTKIKTENFSVYVPTGNLASLDDESKISVPVKTIHGWHLVQVLESKKMDLDDYAEILQETEFKDKEKSEQLAQSRAKMYWSRLKSAEAGKWQSELHANYGITEKDKKLDPNWEKSEYLINSDKLKITSKEFKQFINWLAKDQGVDATFITADQQAMQRYYQIYTDLQVFNKEGEVLKIKESDEFKQRREIEKKQFLSELYKKKNWYAEVSYTDKELKDAYDKMKKNKPPHMKTLKPFSDMRGDLIRQVRGQKINSLTHAKMDELLKSVNLTYVEKEFKQAKDGKH